jgi:hypothetical protein
VTSQPDDANSNELIEASRSIEAVVPDDFIAWRKQADLFIKAVKQLETRQIEADESIKLMGIPLRESALRDAAEEALRNCAHFAATSHERIAVIDEANNIRRTSWF